MSTLVGFSLLHDLLSTSRLANIKTNSGDDGGHNSYTKEVLNTKRSTVGGFSTVKDIKLNHSQGAGQAHGHGIDLY